MSPKPIKPQEYVGELRIKAPRGMTPDVVLKLVQKVIDAGATAAALGGEMEVSVVQVNKR